MATTHRSDLVDELEKALRDEAYDGGMGALGPEKFTDYVRGLAVTAAKVVEEAHTPADDEREALIEDSRRAAGALEEYEFEGLAGDASGLLNRLADLAAGFRRSEVPEPSAEHKCSWACGVDKYGRDYHPEPLPQRVVQALAYRAVKQGGADGDR